MAKPIDPHESLYPADTAAVLEQEAGRSDSLAKYFESLDIRYRKIPTVYTTAVEPVSKWAGMGTPHSGDDPLRTGERAFCYGGLLGLRVAERCGGAALLGAMREVTPEPLLTVEKYQPTEHGDVSRALLVLARAEYTAANERIPTLGGLIKGWEPQLDFRYYDHLVELGFGFVGDYACRAMIQQGSEAALQDAATYNWDNLL
ncbi:hypothetical protein EYC59_06530 [Candidatus Saccharibacteria bacterium]|nr:MAG: hypothetical protein EYC59_06530 [Candidatus Saccharibacteria bacterium]